MDDCLFCKTSDKKLILCDIFKIIAAGQQQSVRVPEKHRDGLIQLSAPAVVNDFVKIVRIIVMLQEDDPVIVAIFMQIDNKFCDTPI